MLRPFPNGQKLPFGCNGYVTAVAKVNSLILVGGSLIGVISASPTQILRGPGVYLESRTDIIAGLP
jgi:hypothetical protein